MDKEAIRDELNKVREQIKILKKDFSQKKINKEAHFTKGEEYSTKINSLYEEIKIIETENNLDKINKDLEAKKVEFEKFKAKLLDVEKEFKDIIKNSKTEFKPKIRTVSVDKAKKDLKKLDLQLQTQVLSLDKESELIKKQEELKEFIDKHNPTPEGSEEVIKAKKELNSIRRKFNNSERRIRSLYKQIRLISKDKKKKYKEIDSLRESKKKAFEEFRIHKKEYSLVSNNLKELFKKEEESMKELGETIPQRKKYSSNGNNNFDKQIKAKQKEVEKKLMKKGGVLTTEDLMLFQKK